jgi:hypothetical protein
MNTKLKGEYSEAIILARLLQQGKTVLKPWGDSQRYDLVIDNGGTFTRIQCKTGRLSKDKTVLKFNTCSVGYKASSRNYKQEIDAFMVYSPEMDKIYYIPVDLAPKDRCSLRLIAPKNKQIVKIMLASDYDF